MSRRDKYRNRGRPDLREIDEPERYFEEDVIKASEMNNAPVKPTNNTLALLGELKKAEERIEDLEAENRKLASRSVLKTLAAFTLGVVIYWLGRLAAAFLM